MVGLAGDETRTKWFRRLIGSATHLLFGQHLLVALNNIDDRRGDRKHEADHISGRHLVEWVPRQRNEAEDADEDRWALSVVTAAVRVCAFGGQD